MMKPGAICLLSVVALFAAGCASASPMMNGAGPGYGMMNGNGSGYHMVQAVEEHSMNATVRAEMEDLMEKMIAGDMTTVEQDRLVQLMNQYPAGYSTMLNRMTGYGTGVCGTDGGFWRGMPFNGTMLAVMTVAMVFAGLFVLVWLIVGVLAILWLLGRLPRR